MVQRKVMANKLGIQDDDNKIENLLPSSSQNQDIKNNKGADLKKKKMKKSGSFKRPDFERVNPSRKPVKPPPLVLPIKTMIESTPNYMKATTSSDSKKERIQVNSQTPQTSSDSKRLSKRNSKNNSESTRTLARTSSLKLVRTLTKAPSFKPVRASAKKVEKATCSSTMKERKFPDYLTLNLGATEGEGTSVMKVCSYSYCSLNGHHHHEAPPLKSFLSSRRRLIKAQRSFKLGCLSPRRGKPTRDILKEFEAAQGNDDVAAPFGESTSFFVEVYSKESDDVAAPSSGVVNEGEEKVKVDAHESITDMESDDYSAQGDIKPDFLNLIYELEAERTPSIQSEEADLEASDMDWEIGVADLILINDVIELEKADLDVDLSDELEFKSGESKIGETCEENMPDEIIQESIDDETEEEDDKDRSDTIEKEMDKASLTSEDMEGSKPEDLTSEVKNIIEPEYKDKAAQYISNQEVKSVTLMNSMGTQTESEFEDTRDEVLKRSIGTQTDFEEDQIQACSFATQCNFLESSENEINEATETQDSIIVFSSDENIHETEMNSVQDESNTLIGSNLDVEATLSGIKKGIPKDIMENEKLREFNPRDPNFLEIEADPEAEKVDLRHLMMDEGKNADDWKLDHALQQAVTKLKPARKKKVALLVEAFETVLPIPKYETHFTHVRPMQACS